MALLIKESENSTPLTDQLILAETLFSRSKGLLGRRELPDNEMLWINRCNSIHTFFMKFTIDCVFLDRTLKVISIKRNVKPWKIIWPQWGASSVIEMKAGDIDRLSLKVGDQLYVGA